MSDQPDIRWIQRFNNFKQALKQLDMAMALIDERDLSDLEQQGMIQAFEYNYELAWNVLKDFYENQGDLGIQGSRDAIRMAFKRGLITDDKLWFDMIKSRALTVHTYNEETTLDILEDVVGRYYPAFCQLRQSLSDYIENEEA